MAFSICIPCRFTLCCKMVFYWKLGNSFLLHKPLELLKHLNRDAHMLESTARLAVSFSFFWASFYFFSFRNETTLRKSQVMTSACYIFSLIGKGCKWGFQTVYFLWWYLLCGQILRGSNSQTWSCLEEVFVFVLNCYPNFLIGHFNPLLSQGQSQLEAKSQRADHHVCRIEWK